MYVLFQHAVIENNCVAIRLLVKEDNVTAIAFYKSLGAESLYEKEHLLPVVINKEKALQALNNK